MATLHDTTAVKQLGDLEALNVSAAMTSSLPSAPFCISL
jgi:hypothetical protein